MAVAFGASRCSHSLVVIGWPVAGLLPNPHQYPSGLMASLGIEPSTTSTNGSSSPRSALCHHSMKLSAPCSGPHSKSMSGQCYRIAVAAESSIHPEDVHHRLGRGLRRAVAGLRGSGHERPPPPCDLAG